MKTRRIYLKRDVVQKKRKRAMLRASWLGVLSVVIIICGVFSLRQPPLKIVSYEIKGVTQSNKNAIKEVLDGYINEDRGVLIPLNTFLTFPSSQIEKIIQQDHLIKSVDVSRNLTYPFTVTIVVDEKKITHTMCMKDTIVEGVSTSCAWFGFDDDGYAIKTLENQSVATASPYFKVDIDSLEQKTQNSILGKKIFPPDAINIIEDYARMLERKHYSISYYEVFGTKTYIHLQKNGYVIVPIGAFTRNEFGPTRKDFEEKISYLESVISDQNLLQNIYSSGTTTTKVAKKTSDTKNASTTKTMTFRYIDARLAKKIFIDPKTVETGTSTSATSTKPK